jgi:hypothetical protein
MSLTPRRPHGLLNYRQFHRALLILVLVCTLSGGWMSAMAAPVQDDPPPVEPTPVVPASEVPVPAAPAETTPTAPVVETPTPSAPVEPTPAAPAGESPTPAAPSELTPAAAANEVLSPAVPVEPAMVDTFGYTMTKVKYDPVSFVDINVGNTPLTFSSSDDGFSGPVAIPFGFKFFENTYTSLYISTNGLITFGRGDNEFRNKPIPYDTLPDNYIAPLWSDLSLGSGGVYVRTIGSPNSRYMVIEWFNVNNHGTPITFEALLYEGSGNIIFKYKSMSDPWNLSTVGIEDPDGLDGLQAAYNSLALKDNTNPPYAYEVRFARPAAYYRAKVSPFSTSNLTVGQKSTYKLQVRNTGDLGADIYKLQVRNTGDLGADIFDLATQNSNPAKWAVSLTTLAGGALIDSNNNGKPDTGSIAGGQGITLTLTLSPASAAGLVAGDYATITLTATSSKAPEVSASSTVKTVVPVPFAQVYVDSMGIHLRQIWEKNTIDKSMTYFTGKTLAVRQVSNKDYMVAWEKRSDMYRFTEIEYQVVSQLNPAGQIKVLTNSQALLSTQVVDSNAEMPTMSSATNGQVGVLWSQRLVRSDNNYNTNIYLGFVDLTGKNPPTRLNLTNNPNYYSSASNVDYERYSTHNLIATGDSRFFACWLYARKSSTNLTTSLNCSSYAYNGTQLQLIAGPMIVDSVAGANTSISTPYLLSLTNNQVMIVYNRSNSSGTQMVHSVWNSSGVQAKAPTVLTGVAGSNPVGVQFSDTTANKNVLLTWADQSGQLGYAYLNSSFVVLPGYPKLLPRVSQRSVAYPSVTLATKSQAVVTWTDADVLNANYLYYLLLDQNGNVPVPAMLFHYPIINTSTYGFGNAAYKGVYQVFLPFMHR